MYKFFYIATHKLFNIKTMAVESTLHRIGGVSSLSGVPVPTLRVWETRHAAFQPAKTGGRHRLYTDDDVLRATLLRQLTDAGHAISTLAQLDAQRLGALLTQQRTASRRREAVSEGGRTVSLAVIGSPLATRVQAAPFLQRLPGVMLQVGEIRKDLDEALAQGLGESPDILLLRVSTLQPATLTALQRLAGQHRVGQVIVLYWFGPAQVIEAMTQAGMRLRREPLSDDELADVLRSLLPIDTMQARPELVPAATIAPRRFSDQTLARVAQISTSVLCECPRHVAELISQLASFEQYSQECLHRSVQDAHLHAQLSAISGSARAMFEQALEMVARHEGITLEP
jgi:MerR family transcriptional regulator, light-induced transcriptional regulator